MQKIMFVDDDPTTLAIARALLEPQYKVLLMKSAVQALGYLRNNPCPDLLLLDSLMPGMSGLEMLGNLKTQPELQNLPVIILTSITNIDFIADTFTMGANDYLVKPIIPILLQKKVETQLYIQTLYQENELLRRQLAKQITEHKNGT